ncbi:MAG TPA: CoA transferase [Acidimicrobiales bacterium]|nr:CoA transferase [Acidimicrobiales bacterium]
MNESSPSTVPPPSADAGAPSPGDPGLLAGVVVLDLSTVGPAARCTRLLADYGATVVKVGAVPGRGAQPITPPFFAYSGARWLQRIAIDLKDPEGRDAFLSLVETADVVVESFRPGVMDRLGTGYADLTAVNPGIILCSTTGFGQSGPRAGWAGHDINYLAVGGFLASSQSRADGGPPIAGATLADAAGGGMQAAMAVMAALIGRRRTGAGAHLDVSVAEGVLWLTSLAVDEHLATGAEVGPGRDILSGRYACYDSYRAADGKWLAVGAIEPKFYANLCRHLGCEQWVAHQLDDEVQDKIRDDFRAAFASRDRADWVEELAGSDTCVSPVQTVAELVDDDQFAARRALVEAVMEGGGDAGPPVRFRQVGPVLAGMVRPDGPVAVRGPAVSDAERLLEAAGHPPERVAELRAKGVVA